MLRRVNEELIYSVLSAFSSETKTGIKIIRKSTPFKAAVFLHAFFAIPLHFIGKKHHFVWSYKTGQYIIVSTQHSQKFRRTINHHELWHTKLEIRWSQKRIHSEKLVIIQFKSVITPQTLQTTDSQAIYYNNSVSSYSYKCKHCSSLFHY